ncbi:MAG: polysaccharide deacetylase family protein [Lachnospiraceae bacterium]|nr:polysaccharide deacetylase family protein [Lachnospiraceae bacterium]
MERGKNALSSTVLTVIWLITAAAALILTVVYLNRLQELYAKADQVNENIVAGENAGDNATDVAQDTGVANNSGDVRVQTGDNNGPEGTDTQTGENDLTDTDAGSDPDNSTDIASADNTDNPDDQDTSTDDPAGISNSDDPDDTDKAGIADNDNTDTGDDNDTVKKNTENYDYTLGIDPEKPIIALSFDDGPSIYTERIIAALEENNAEATFFMVGYNVKNYKDVVKLVYDAGMEIGNHTSDHKKLTDQSKETIRSQVFDNEDLINSIVPVGRIIVRPPYGSHNSTVRSIVQRPMFNWSVDSLDWKTRNADSIVAQIKQDARDGYIVLMHDLYETTAEAAERIIPWLIDQGYQVTSISKMFKARGIKLEDGTVYRMVEE